MADTWMVLGLGNPGDRYARTRHNVGQMVVDELVRRAGARYTSHKSRTVVASARIGTLPGGAPGPRVLLAKSQGYMNESGGPAAALARAEGIDPDHVLVIHDELDLPEHTLRLKDNGGEGGHNGLKSISQHFGTREYPRLRIGIGRPPGTSDAKDFVLKPMTSRDLTELEVTVQQAADVVEDILLRGFTAAQMTLHTS